MEQLLSDLITDATLRQKLEKSGYENVTDIKDVGVVQVTEELQLSKEEVQIILKLIHGGHILASQTAEDRIKTDNQKTGISFSCKAFDGLFDRYQGVPPSCITDLCGEPGSGKTQICMQLAVNAPECIYIDTEGSVFPGRLRQLAESILVKTKKDEFDKPLDVESILKNIHVFRVYDHVQLIALTRQLFDILDELNQVKLLILDSITYPLRTNIDIKLRNNILAFVGQNLAQLASRHKLAVVVTNHVKEDHLNTAVTPALGEDWGRRCANRFFLYRTRERRYARYYKSSIGTKDTTLHFKITNDGLEDTSKDEEQNHIMHEDENSSFNQHGDDDQEEEEEEEDVWETSHFTDQVISQIPSQDNSQQQIENDVQRISHNALSSSLQRLKRKRDIEGKEEEQQLLASSASLEHKKPSITITANSNTVTTTISNNHQRKEQPEKSDDDDDEFGWGSEDEEDALFFAAYDSP